jgi:hypothetical protein
MMLFIKDLLLAFSLVASLSRLCYLGASDRL